MQSESINHSGEWSHFHLRELQAHSQAWAVTLRKGIEKTQKCLGCGLIRNYFLKGC